MAKAIRPDWPPCRGVRSGVTRLDHCVVPCCSRVALQDRNGGVNLARNNGEQRMCAGLLSDAEPPINGAAPITSDPRLPRCCRRRPEQTRCGHGAFLDPHVHFDDLAAGRPLVIIALNTIDFVGNAGSMTANTSIRRALLSDQGRAILAAMPPPESFPGWAAFACEVCARFGFVDALGNPRESSCRAALRDLDSVGLVRPMAFRSLANAALASPVNRPPTCSPRPSSLASIRVRSWASSSR